MLSNADGLVAVVVTTSTYPQRVVFADFIVAVFDRFTHKNYNWQNGSEGELTKKFKGDFNSLCSEYDDPAAKNKVAKLKAQVNDVQGVMQDNISKALSNFGDTSDIDDKTKEMVRLSKDFDNKAKKLAWREWCMLQKMRCMIFAVFLLVIIVVVIMICTGTPGACGGGGDSATPAAASSGTVATPAAARRLEDMWQ